MEWKELGAEENHGIQLKYKGVKGEWRVKRKVKEIGQNNEMEKDIIRNWTGNCEWNQNDVRIEMHLVEMY